MPSSRWARGDVGQSLNLPHRESVRHGFMDMNVFYTEDELRKQADTFTGKVVNTSQEAPSTDKRLREDLCKKVMSGDPVAARLPCAILTKMVTFSGWNRFEMDYQVPWGYGNDVPVDHETVAHHQLQGEVCQRRAPREPPPGHPGVLSHAGGHERIRDLTACGWCPVHFVLGELCDFSVVTFPLKIERYAEGGWDGGLTRATMRAACGLPAEAVAFHPDGAAHGVACRPGAGVVDTVAARQVLGCGRACPVPCVS